MRETYTAPNVSDADLTPRFVRDELLRCFESANQQFFDLLGQPVTDEQLRAQVREFVTGVFQECGLPFETPTKAGIRAAINRCKANAEGMMGDKGADIIRHHYAEMTKLVDRLPDSTTSG